MTNSQLPYDARYRAEVFEASEAYGLQETEFYHQLGEAHPGVMLELGCGTGVHVLRLAEWGHEAWGLDLMPQFVEYAREKATVNSDVAARAIFEHGDMIDFKLPRQFSVIFVTCGSLYYVTDIEDRLSLACNAAAHLCSGGVLAISSEYFALKAAPFPLHSDGFHRVQHGERLFEVNHRQYKLVHDRLYNPVAQTIVGEERIVRLTDPSEEHPPRRVNCHVSTPDELELLLLAVGLRVVGRYGDSDGRPLDTGRHDKGWAILVGQAPR